MARIDPQSVQALIGDRGQHLTGPFVEIVFGDEKVFDFVTQLQLGGPADAALDAEARAKGQAALHDWVLKTCATNIDLMNALVRSGEVAGRPILGGERQARIEACLREVTESSEGERRSETPGRRQWMTFPRKPRGGATGAQAYL